MFRIPQFSYISFGNDKKPRAFEELDDFELKDPNTYLRNLKLEDYENLLVDIKVYRLLDDERKQREFWDDVTTICEGELKRLKDSQRDEAVHSSVQDDVLKTFKVGLRLIYFLRLGLIMGRVHWLAGSTCSCPSSAGSFFSSTNRGSSSSRGSRSKSMHSSQSATPPSSR